MKRYSSLDYIFSLNISDAMELIQTAVQESNKEKILFRWIVGGYERIMSYSEFKTKLYDGIDTKQIIDTRTEAEILADVKDILAAARH